MNPTRSSVLADMHRWLRDYPSRPRNHLIAYILYNTDFHEYDPDSTPSAPTEKIRQMVEAWADYAMSSHEQPQVR